jgi:hypothetical protein
MMIPAHRAAQGVLQALGRIEAGGGQHRADTAIAALDPAVSLGMTGLDEAVVDVVVLASAIKAMTPGGVTFAGGAAAIGEFLAIISQNFLHREGRLSDESLEKRPHSLPFSRRESRHTPSVRRDRCRRTGSEARLHPACAAVT